MTEKTAAGDAAAGWLSNKLNEMEQVLATLVNINSFTDNPEGGRKTGLLLSDLFSMPGTQSRVVESNRFADHLIVRTRPDEPNKDAIALVGHLDTVFPPGTFEGYRREGALARGPGVLDMKGGLVVIAFAMKAIAETHGLDKISPIRLVIVADEEVGSPEGQGIIGAAISGSRAALVFEAGRKADAIITRRKGTAGLTVIAHGKAAHAGNSHKDGINAIWALAKFVDAAQKVTDYDRGTSINVGKFTGGHGKNTVPDRAEALVDFRFTTHADGVQVLERLQKAARDAEANVPGATLAIQGGILRQPLERSEANVALMKSYGACAKACGLGFAEAALIGGGSDASTSAALGIPSIDGLGPRGAGFHTKDEHIEIDSLVPKAQALARFLTLKCE